MDKAKFLAEFAPRSEPFELPGGESVPITELTAAQRATVARVSVENPGQTNATIVALGCALFDVSDVDRINELPNRIVADMADAILGMSGLADKESAEKN